MKRNSGFTLIELLITLAIAGILLLFAVPSFSTLLQNNRSTALANSFITALHYARSEAIKRNQRVTLCPSTPPYTSCSETGGHWEQGWITFSDTSNFGIYDPGELILHVHQASPTDISLIANRTIDTYISYTGDGFSKQKNGAKHSGKQGGTLYLCNPRTHRSEKSIVISLNGRIRMEYTPRSC